MADPQTILYGTRRALDALSSQPSKLAEIISQHQYLEQSIKADKTRTKDYQHMQLSQLHRQTQHALDELRSQREQTAASVKMDLANVAPRMERSETDSAWNNRVKPLLDRHSPENLGDAMGHVAHDPAARQAVKENGTLYVRTRLHGKPDRMIKAMTDMVLQQLSKAEDAHISPAEKEAKAQAIELEHGLHNLNLADSMVREAIGGQRVVNLPGWTKRDTLPLPSRR